MSSLQCAATLILSEGRADLAAQPGGRRISHVLAKGDVPGLSSDDLATLREALSGIADQTPGETTLVLALDHRLRAALPHLARLEVSPEVLANAPRLALVIDADDWVCRPR